uniref:Ubiquitin-like domain-containing protein n=1 Tax=Panagrellus redivivus TaxID=6233 RepID=A0A7E4V4Q2_PANRE
MNGIILHVSSDLGAFMMSLIPEDTIDTIKQTVEWAQEIPPEYQVLYHHGKLLIPFNYNYSNFKNEDSVKVVDIRDL